MSYNGFDSPFGFVGMHGTGGAGPSSGGYGSSANQNPYGHSEDNWQKTYVKEFNAANLEMRTVSREYDDVCSLERQCKRELKALPGKQEERRVLREEWLMTEKEKKEKQAEEEIKEVRRKIKEQEKKMRYGNNVPAGNVDRARKYIREQSAQVYAEILMLRNRQQTASETAPVVEPILIPATHQPDSDEFLLSSEDFVVDHEEVLMVNDESTEMEQDQADGSGSEVSSSCETSGGLHDEEMIVEEISGDSENQDNQVEMNVEDSAGTTNQDDEEPVRDQEIKLDNQEPASHPLTIDQILAEVGDSEFGDAIRKWQQHEEWQNFAISGIDLKLHLFNPFGCQIEYQPVRKPASGRDLFLFQIEANNKIKLTEEVKASLWESMGEDRRNEWKGHRANIVKLQKEQQTLRLVEALQSKDYKSAMVE
ncbi:hypothetical protein GCK72_007034 [Caenorhabditis remanei]|uniref:Uncharacterized protein n=1 Tax=Caenorhabditis remanei TaxID=31234 RepID=A0A6A5HK65_CAERE|nr:hypothetical protein GCK72_007034 [Caenorhabditis remanei]KAF1767076.1 hypothetical protein GCK72_007034 [Caenorhabditis remanei]